MYQFATITSPIDMLYMWFNFWRLVQV